jgi:hypothetical protein
MREVMATYAGPQPTACSGCRAAEDRFEPADLVCSSCGIALCGACAGPRTACPRCAMPWMAPVEQVRLLRAYARAVAATWPRRVSTELVEALERALEAGVPREALRRAYRREITRIRLASLEAASREAGG